MREGVRTSIEVGTVYVMTEGTDVNIAWEQKPEIRVDMLLDELKKGIYRIGYLMNLSCIGLDLRGRVV